MESPPTYKSEERNLNFSSNYAWNACFSAGTSLSLICASVSQAMPKPTPIGATMVIPSGVASQAKSLDHKGLPIDPSLRPNSTHPNWKMLVDENSWHQILDIKKSSGNWRSLRRSKAPPRDSYSCGHVWDTINNLIFSLDQRRGSSGMEISPILAVKDDSKIWCWSKFQNNPMAHTAQQAFGYVISLPSPPEIILASQNTMHVWEKETFWGHTFSTENWPVTLCFFALKRLKWPILTGYKTHWILWV